MGKKRYLLTILFFTLLGWYAGMLTVVDTVDAGNIRNAILKKYPDNLYIVRSGSGETSEDAAEAARLEISKYFEASIHGETMVNQWLKVRTAKGKAEEMRGTEITNTINVSSSRDIPGIEIIPYGQDISKKLFEVWAVLEKKSYARSLLEKIRKIDEDVDRKMADKEGGDMRRVLLLSQSAHDIMSREQALGDLNLLEQGRDVPSRSSLFSAVMNSLDSLVAGAFDTGLVFGSGIDDKVKFALIKGIVDVGIRIREYPDFPSAVNAGADLVLSVEYKVDIRETKVALSDKDYIYFWADWMVSLKALEPSTREIIETLVLNDKANGGSEAQARERMVNAMLKTQVPKITSWVYGIIFKPEK